MFDVELFIGAPMPHNYASTPCPYLEVMEFEKEKYLGKKKEGLLSLEELIEEENHIKSVLHKLFGIAHPSIILFPCKTSTLTV